MKPKAFPENRPTELPLRLQDLVERGIASRATIWRWSKAGLKVHKVGRATFVFPSDLESFIRNHGEKTN